MPTLREHDVTIVAAEPERQSVMMQLLIASFLVLLIGLFLFFMRNMQAGQAVGLVVR